MTPRQFFKAWAMQDGSMDNNETFNNVLCDNMLPGSYDALLDDYTTIGGDPFPSAQLYHPQPVAPALDHTTACSPYQTPFTSAPRGLQADLGESSLAGQQPSSKQRKMIGLGSIQQPHVYAQNASSSYLPPARAKMPVVVDNYPDANTNHDQDTTFASQQYVVKDPDRINGQRKEPARLRIPTEDVASETWERSAVKRQKTMLSPPTTNRSRSVIAGPSHIPAWDPSSVALQGFAEYVASHLYYSPHFESKLPEDRLELFPGMLQDQWVKIKDAEAMDARQQPYQQKARSEHGQADSFSLPCSETDSPPETRAGARADVSPYSSEEERPPVGSIRNGNKKHYTTDQINVLEAYVRERRKAKHKCVRRSSRHSRNCGRKFLPCFKVGCSGIFNDRSRWDRHMQPLIVKEAWLCPFCYGQGINHFEIRPDRFKNHLLKESHVSTDDEAWEVVSQYDPYIPPFRAPCGVCNATYHDRAKWLDHVYDHCAEADDCRALKADWNDRYEFPPPFPERVSRSGCRPPAVRASKKPDEDEPENNGHDFGGGSDQHLPKRSRAPRREMSAKTSNRRSRTHTRRQRRHDAGGLEGYERSDFSVPTLGAKKSPSQPHRQACSTKPHSGVAAPIPPDSTLDKIGDSVETLTQYVGAWGDGDIVVKQHPRLSKVISNPTPKPSNARSFATPKD